MILKLLTRVCDEGSFGSGGSVSFSVGNVVDGEADFSTQLTSALALFGACVGESLLDVLSSPWLIILSSISLLV